MFIYRCEHGVIIKLYPASELEGYTGELPFNSDDWEHQPRVSLREAATLSNPWNHFLANSCHCTQGCATKRCRCVRNGIECSTHCHSSKMYYNKKNDRDGDKGIYIYILTCQLFIKLYANHIVRSCN